ncbi:MAG TPA: hypothetical protein VFQ66_08800, partial [Candidatus Limnocylindria bacterium]|nr:hypothetical protein [Candidatus Limnocylindria bacterium]
MQQQRLDLRLHRVADIDDGAAIAERLEEERLGLVRLELLVAPELGEHLSGGRVRIDGAERHLARCDVIGMVDVP